MDSNFLEKEFIVGSSPPNIYNWMSIGARVSLVEDILLSGRMKDWVLSEAIILGIKGFPCVDEYRAMMDDMRNMGKNANITAMKINKISS